MQSYEERFGNCQFVWSSSQFIIHDKSCRYVKRIKQSNSIMTKKNSCVLSMRSCKYCQRNLLIRYIVGNSYWSIYEPLFDTISTSILQDLVYKKRIEVVTHRDFIQITCDEDNWQIKLAGNGKVELWHNDYIRTLGNQRYFKDSYHLQFKNKVTLALALDAIATYKYDRLKHTSGLQNL